MLTPGINFTNFKIKKQSSLVKKNLISILKSKNEVVNSLSQNYKNSFTKKLLHKYKKTLNYRVIGMGGSTLGTQTIYNFLKHKITKKFIFTDNLQANPNKNEKKYTNLIVSKSGNTIETIVNANIYIKNKNKNIFITGNKSSYLYSLAEKLKSDIIHHNNFIGGRYSVLSEVGMLPAELMGLKSSNFRQLNNLIKNKKFINSLILNVSSTLYFIKKKRFNSVTFTYTGTPTVTVKVDSVERISSTVLTDPGTGNTGTATLYFTAMTEGHIPHVNAVETETSRVSSSVFDAEVI